MENIETDKKTNWRQFGKHWIVVFILAILAAVVIWSLLNVGPWLRNLQDWWTARSIRAELEKQYRDDKYGGKTPEETFDLFIAALEKGDVDLASKYFVIKKQNSWVKTLDSYKAQALLNDFIQELKNNQKIWEKAQITNSDLAEFNYKVVVDKNTTADFNGQKIPIQAGEYTNFITFQKYPSGNWKINDL